MRVFLIIIYIFYIYIYNLNIALDNVIMIINADYKIIKKG